VLRLLKFLIFTAGLAGLVWWGLTVPLGERTLFGHLRAIGDSKESQELVRGTKQKVGDLKKRMADENDEGKDDENDEDDASGGGKSVAGARSPEKPQPPEPDPRNAAEAAPQENLTSGDRTQMRRLLQARAKTQK